MNGLVGRYFSVGTCGLLAVWLCGCPGTVGPLGAGATSVACPQLTGAVAIQYDVQNGIPTAQLTTVPVVANLGGNYIHPAYPPLGFIYPVGWTPETISEPSTFGVNLLRDDFQSMWRWVFAEVAVGTSAATLRELETNQLVGFFGAGGPVTTICPTDVTDSPAPGITRQFSSALIQFDTSTAIIVTSTFFVDGLPAGSAFVELTVSPTAEIDTDIFETYLPIHFQLLVGESSIVDTDGDGVSDTIDDFPFDPTRS